MSAPFDICVREHWESLSTKVRVFKVASHIEVVNEKLLKKAKEMHDSLLGKPVFESRQVSEYLVAGV